MAGKSHFDERGFGGGRRRWRLELCVKQISEVTIVETNVELAAGRQRQFVINPNLQKRQDFFAFSTEDSVDPLFLIICAYSLDLSCKIMCWINSSDA